jgi:hypothetical protein
MSNWADAGLEVKMATEKQKEEFINEQYGPAEGIVAPDSATEAGRKAREWAQQNVTAEKMGSAVHKGAVAVGGGCFRFFRAVVLGSKK